MINVGDTLSTVGDIMSTVGGYLEYCRGCSVPWGYPDARGDIMSTVGVFSTVGGYHQLKFEYRGGDIMIHVGGIS